MVTRWLVAASIAVGLASCTSPARVERPPDAPPDVFARLEGYWGWLDDEASCDRNPHSIEFSDDHGTMVLRYEEPIAMPDDSVRSEMRYEVVGQGPNKVRLSVEGEMLRTPNGERITWELIMMSPNHLCWRRTDWPTGTCTQPVERC